MTITELWNEVELESNKSSGLVPDPEEMYGVVPVSLATIKKLYDRWCDEDKLYLDNGKYYIKTNTPPLIENIPPVEEIKLEETKVEPILQEVPDNITHQQVIVEKPKPVKRSPPKKPTKKFDIKRNIFKLLCFGIGCCLLVCSIWFTYQFNKITLNSLLAFVLSISIVSFTSFAFSMATFVSKRTRVVLYILWIIGTSYSVFTAVAGEYEKFISYTARDEAILISKQISNYDKQLQDLYAKVPLYTEYQQKELEYNTNPDLKTENPGTWRLIREKSDELKGIEDKIEDLLSKKNELTEREQVNREKVTVFTWLHDTTKLPANWWQLLVILFPAAFIDLASGVVFKFALGDDK